MTLSMMIRRLARPVHAVCCFLAVAMYYAPLCAVAQSINDAPTTASRTRTAVVRPPASGETLSQFVRLRNRLRNFRAEWGTLDGRGVLRGVTAELGKGPVSVTGIVDYTRPDSFHHLKIEVRDSDAMALLDILRINLDGRIHAPVSVDADLRWSGLKLTAMKSSVSGPVHFRSGQGRILGVGVMEQLFLALELPNGTDVAFQDADLKGSLGNGTLRIEKGRAKVADFRAELSMSLDLLSEEFRAEVTAFLPPSARSRSRDPAIRDDSAKSDDSTLELPVRVNFFGSLTNPKVQAMQVLNIQNTARPPHTSR